MLPIRLKTIHIKKGSCSAWPFNFLKFYQPVSRILSPIESGDYHLSCPNITVKILLPTLQHRTSRPQTLIYVALQHTRFTRSMHYCKNPWALTSRFHPGPNIIGVVIFCGTFFPILRQAQDQARPLTGVLLFAVRTFLLPVVRESDSPADRNAKVNLIFLDRVVSLFGTTNFATDSLTLNFDS